MSGSEGGEYQAAVQSAWDTLRLIAYGFEPRPVGPTTGGIRYEGACRLLADGVDIRIVQLMLGHSSIQQTQRYLHLTDEELRKGLEANWSRRRPIVW